MDEIRNATESLLLQCGVSPALRGFEALRTAIELVVEDPSILRNAQRTLYPAVAQGIGIPNNISARQYMYRAFYGFLDNADLSEVHRTLQYAPRKDKEAYTLKTFIGAAAIAVRREVARA